MTYTQRDDRSRAGEASTETRRITRAPVRSLTRALDHLDDTGLCCWVALALVRSRSARSVASRRVASG